MEILVTSKQIRDKIRWVLGDTHDERIALVAFVGHDAVKFLANPKGIQLYCWLKVLGTNPNGLRSLLSRDVDLFEVNNLHMKLYWSRKRGAVLGSANLSENALGNDVQFELAVYLPPKTVDIKRLMKRFVARKIDGPRIDSFETRYNLYPLRNQDDFTQFSSSKSQTPNFLDWCSLRRKSIETPFRLYWWWEEANPPNDALKVVKQETGSDYNLGFINSMSKKDYELGEWVLSFRESSYTNGDIRPLKIGWFVPQEYARTQEKGWAKYSHIWFQVRKTLQSEPFDLQDPIFKKALTNVLIEHGNDVENVVMKNSTQPTGGFLRSLEQKYREIKRTRE
jgi:hypothetical protein